MRIWSARISWLILPEEDSWSLIKFCINIPHTEWQSIHYYVIQLGILIIHKVQKGKRERVIQTHHLQSELHIFFLFNLHNHLVIRNLSFHFIQKQKGEQCKYLPNKGSEKFRLFPSETGDFCHANDLKLSNGLPSSDAYTVPTVVPDLNSNPSLPPIP